MKRVPTITATKPKPAGEWREFRLVIALDPGLKTGFAIWDGKTLEVQELPIWEVFMRLETWHKSLGWNVLILLEDARKNYRPKNETDEGSDARKMGAGWIRTLSALYEHFLKAQGFKYMTKRKGITKIQAEQFLQITKVSTKTTEHNARDAGMMVWQHPLRVFVPNV